MTDRVCPHCGAPMPLVPAGPADQPPSAPTLGQERRGDEFLQEVALYYSWALSAHLRPGKALAEACDVSPRTAQHWIYRARKRGILPPASQGRASA